MNRLELLARRIVPIANRTENICRCIFEIETFFVETLRPHCHRSQVSIKTPERSFMFNTGFQSSSALAKNMEYAVGVLSAQPDFAEELRKELDGQVYIDYKQKTF